MISHLVGSTITALLAIGIVFALRRQSAALRHAILLAAMLRFLIPTPWLEQAGSKLASCLPSRVMSLPVVEDVSRLLRHAGEIPNQTVRPGSSGPSLVPAISWVWAVGSVLSLFLWLRGLLRRVPQVREANSVELAAFDRALPSRRGAVALRIISPGLSPGARGLLRPTILLPDGLSSELTDPEIDAVLAHELAHIGRKDNWASALARIIACVFWFHPLLWWMERRMLQERETACDELVLARGASAADYAGAIAKVCRLVWEGSPAYAGIADSNLKQRMEHIMASPSKRPTSRRLITSLAALAALAILLPMAGGFLRAQLPAVSSSAADQLYQACLGNLKAGRYAEAEEGFRRLREMEPSNPRGVVGIAVVYLQQGREEEAMRLVEGELQANPKLVNLGLAMGDFYIDAKKFDLAVEEFKRLLGSADDSQILARIYARIGEAYRQAGNLNQAMWAFKQATEQNPMDNASRLTLALILEGTGKREAARQMYVKVLDQDPRNAVALNNLAYILADSGGDLKAATGYALRAREALPKSLDVSDIVGWIYVKRQMADEAIAVLKETVMADPANLYFRSHLASAIDLKGLDEPFIVELKQALRSKTTPPEKIVQLLGALP